MFTRRLAAPRMNFYEIPRARVMSVRTRLQRVLRLGRRKGAASLADCLIAQRSWMGMTKRMFLVTIGLDLG
jgi:hypothetical protein